MIFAGSGGQGIQFSGKQMAKSGMYAGYQVTFLPSYGPEMRGGTANCSVIISDEAVGSPIVSKPDILVCMNLPSLDKFEKAAAVGAKIFVDSTLIERKVLRTDVETFYIPATRLATDAGTPTLANMIITGKILKETGFDTQSIKEALKKVVSAKHPELYDKNLNAINIGYNL